MLAGGIDVEEDALGIADVAAVEQWGIQSVEDGILNSAFSAGSAHSHDGTAAALDGGLDVTEVEIDSSLYGYQFRDALGGTLSTLSASLKASFTVISESAYTSQSRSLLTMSRASTFLRISSTPCRAFTIFFLFSK